MRLRLICMLCLVVSVIFNGCYKVVDIDEANIEVGTEKVQALDSVVTNSEGTATILSDAKIINFYVEINDTQFDLNSEWNSNEISILAAEELLYLRNSVYAKHGYVFKNKQYADYFSEFEWYIEDENFMESDFTTADTNNIKLVQKFEREFILFFQKSIATEMSNGIVISNENIKLTSIDIESTDNSNKPRRVIISVGESKVFYDSFWNDGLFASIVDFDKMDNFIDIYIIDSNTDISSTTIIYRFDGTDIIKYGELDHFGGNFIYDGKGKIYYWYGDSGSSDYNYYYDYKLNESYVIEDILLKEMIKKAKATQN